MLCMCELHVQHLQEQIVSLTETIVTIATQFLHRARTSPKSCEPPRSDLKHNYTITKRPSCLLTCQSPLSVMHHTRCQKKKHAPSNPDLHHTYNSNHYELHHTQTPKIIAPHWKMQAQIVWKHTWAYQHLLEL